MKARFTDEQIIAMIKEQESGEKTADVDLSRFRAAPGARLSHFFFESDWTIPAQC
jgi:hypothetical protein